MNITKKSTSNLFHFNATCEMAIANGNNSFKPPLFLQRFESELELLPMYLASKSDYLLVDKEPSELFLKRLAILKPDLPFIGDENAILKALSEGKLFDAIEPWGWSPAEHYKMKAFKGYCSSHFLQQSNALWDADHKALYSRETALDVLRDFIQYSSTRDLFLPMSDLPKKCSSIEYLQVCMQHWKSVIVKSPWSSSGRGMIILFDQNIHSTYIKWINGVIKKQGFVMVEPRLNKCCDLSFHFNVEANKGIRFLGQASFKTEENGQYVGNNIQALPLGLNEEEQAFLCSAHLSIISKGLQQALLKSPIYKNYTGALGIDVLVYRDENKQLRIQPCLEINLRNNMGTVALKIRDLMHVEAKGIWQVKYFNEASRAECLNFDEKMREQYPLVTDSGKLLKGYLPLIEPYADRKFALYLLAE